MAVRYKKVRGLVEELLARHMTGPGQVPVECIIEAEGAIVVRTPAEDSLAGYIVRDLKARSVVIGVNSCHPDTRQAFTLAHECGHLLLHAGYEMHVDRKDGSQSVFLVNLRNEQSSQGTNDEEREANLFAAELLMPERFLRQELVAIEASQPNLLSDGDECIRHLSGTFGVSAQALTYRLQNLGWIRTPHD